MKKLIIVIGVCFLLLAMPATIAISTPNLKLAKRSSSIFTRVNFDKEKNGSPEDDPPGWANGNFSGLWGLDIWGQWHIPVGWTYGYYKRTPEFGYFYAGFGNFAQENASWYIQGYFFGPFMFGSMGENEYANETLFVGIGGINETDYHWRMMGKVGPTFYVEGTYTKF